MKTLHQKVLTINTDYDITNTGELIVFVEFVSVKLNHEIIQNSDACTMQLCPKTKTNNYTKQSGSARGDAWLRRISANNLLNSFRKCQ